MHWVVRESEHYQCADVNSTFFRPEGRARFDRVTWPERLDLMARYRRASIMFEFRPMIERAEAEGRLVVYRGKEIRRVTTGLGGTVGLELDGGGRIEADCAVLALSTTPSIGRGLLARELVNERDGWPALHGRTLALARAPRVFVVGAAAGMILGPAARNIDGHRVATTRVAATIAHELLRDRPQADVRPQLEVAAGA